MGVYVSPDDGPSYCLHEPKPASGPAICDNCVHVRYGRGPGGSFNEPRYAEHWTCGAVPDKVNRPAGVDPITGETIPASVVKVRCATKNKRGDCADYRSRKQPRMSFAEEPTQPRDNEPRKLAPEHLVLSAMLVFALGMLLGAAIATAV